MKNLKFGLALALLLGGFAAVGAVVAPSASEVKRVEAAEVLTDSISCPSGTVSNNKMTFTTDNGMFTIVHAKESSSNFSAYSPWRVYNKTSLAFTAKNSSINITKMVFTCSGDKYVKNFTVKAGSIGGTTSAYTLTKSGTTQTLTFDEADNIGYVYMLNSDTAQARFSKIVISYTSASIEPSLAIATPSTTDVIVEGNQVQLSCNVLNADDATINWHTTDSSIISVADGLVSAVSAGKASVYASIAVDGTTYESNKVEFTSYDFRESFEVEDSLTMTPANFPTGSYHYGIYKMGEQYYNLYAGYKGTDGDIQIKKTDGYFYNYRPYSKTIKSIEIATKTPGFTLYGDKSYGKSAEAKKITPISENNVLTYDLTGDDYNYFYLGEATETLHFTSITLKFEAEIVDTHSVTFNANGGAFVDPDEWSSMEFEDERTVVLPIASDLETTAYKYTTLVGWTDGNETYAPGESVVVTSSTTFTAVYEAPELITVAQALEICELTGTTNTEYAFTVQGVVSELDASGVSQYGNFTCMLTDETGTIEAFRVKCDKTGLDLLDGDTIRVTGLLVNYGGNTPEFTAGGTYEFVSRPVVEPTLEEKLAEFTTNASVGFSYTKSGEDYTFSNVRLSFRGTISAELYDEVVAAGVTAAGIEVSIEGQEPYTINCTTSIGTDANGNKYVFGSLLVPEGKENIVVTGKAFVTVDGARLYLASTAHSLVSAVSAYLGDNAPALTAEQLEAVTALAASLGIAA